MYRTLKVTCSPTVPASTARATSSEFSHSASTVMQQVQPQCQYGQGNKYSQNAITVRATSSDTMPVRSGQQVLPQCRYGQGNNSHSANKVREIATVSIRSVKQTQCRYGHGNSHSANMVKATTATVPIPSGRATATVPVRSVRSGQ